MAHPPYITDDYDLIIVNGSYIVLSSQVARGCIILGAVDDMTAEDTEVFYVNGMPLNPLDSVPEQSLVEIADDDGNCRQSLLISHFTNVNVNYCRGGDLTTPRGYYTNGRRRNGCVCKRQFRS